MSTVILVPGMGGTKLLTEYSFLRGSSEVWLSSYGLASGGVFHLRLSDNGLRPYYALSPALVPGTRIDFYYPPLEGYLGARGWQVLWAGDDWRRDIDSGVQRLVQLIASVGAPDPVRIVAHSRGGLVVQRACQLLAQQGALGLVRQVVAVCCPFAGSYCPFPFLGGYILGEPDAKGIWQVVGVLDGVPFLSGYFRDICVSLPGMYELLPDPVIADMNGGEFTAGWYDPAAWSAEGVPVNAAHLTDALARWQGRPAFPAGVRVDCVVGVGVPTAGGGLPGFTTVGRSEIPRGGTGDGTVPDWSASLVGRNNVRVPTAHNEALRNPAVLGIVDGLLRS